MKLPASPLDVKAALQEFDVWITPTLGEIRDTDRFKQQLELVADIFDALGKATKNFERVETCDPKSIASTFVSLIRDQGEVSGAKTKLGALASVLFLVTGKSDNNAKCQLPIYLQHKAKWQGIPSIKQKNGEPELASIPVPRVLDSERYMGLVAALIGHPDTQETLLLEFVRFVLSDDKYVSQLWSVGHSYFMLKALGKHKDLLSPLVVFQVRGSVAASGGHDPEALLRDRLLEWGLKKGIDYNVNDVVLKTLPSGSAQLQELSPDSQPQAPIGEPPGEQEQQLEKIKEKTRAYDFALPFKTPGWSARVFVQSQFYAGDSGSVSHKNVDQTQTSRKSALEQFPDARFVEYVDGAGYFSSLNGDLKKLLQMPTTTSFCQVRSVAIRLRRELQSVGFLIPLEIYHAIFRTNASVAELTGLLVGEGYSAAEVVRAIAHSKESGLLIAEANARLEVPPAKRDVARRYFLLDMACREGKPLDNRDNLKGHFLVPGYGPFFGLPVDELARKAGEIAPGLQKDWAKAPQIILEDIRWLCEQGFAMSGI